MKYEEKEINRSEQISEIYIPTVNLLVWLVKSYSYI